MLQTLSDPLFAVPFLGALGVGATGVALGGGYAWLTDRRADARLGRLAGRVGGVGLAGIGVASVVLGLQYAGALARIQRDPSALGRVGLALPWGDVASAVGVVAFGCIIASVGLSAYATRADSGTAD